MEENIDPNADTMKIFSEIEQIRALKNLQQQNLSFKDLKEQSLQYKRKHITKAQQIETQDLMDIENNQDHSRAGKYKKGKNYQPPECLNGQAIKIAEIKSHYKNWRLIGKVVAKGAVINRNNQYKTFCFEIQDLDNDKLEIQCKDQVCDMFYSIIQLEKYYIISGIYAPEDIKCQKQINMKLVYLQKWSDVKEIQIAQTHQNDFMKHYDHLIQATQANNTETPKTIRYLGQNTYQNVRLTSLFFPNPEDERIYYSFLQRTKTSLLICMYTLRSTDIIFHLQQMNSIQIRIIVDWKQSIKDEQRQNLIALSQLKNIEIKLIQFPTKDGSMHNKYVIIDSQTLMTGSLNWSVTAFKKSNENVIIIEDSKTSLEYTVDFERLWVAGTPFIQETEPCQQIVDKQLEDIVVQVVDKEVSVPIIKKSIQKKNLIIIRPKQTHQKRSTHQETSNSQNTTQIGAQEDNLIDIESTQCNAKSLVQQFIQELENSYIRQDQASQGVKEFNIQNEDMNITVDEWYRSNDPTSVSQDLNQFNDIEPTLSTGDIQQNITEMVYIDNIYVELIIID